MVWPLLLVMLQCFNLANGLSITPIPEGVLMKKGLNVRSAAMQWEIVVVMDDIQGKIAKDVIQEIDVLREFLDGLSSNKAFYLRRDHWYRELDRAENRIKILKPRYKRGLLDLVGRLAKDLFGTATEGEIFELRAKVNENRQSLQHVIHFQNQLMSIVNVTHDDMNLFRKTLNQLINTTDAIKNWMTRNMGRLTTTTQGIIAYNIIGEKMNLIWRHVDTLVDTINGQGIQKNALEQGRLHESILPRNVLREVADLQSHPEIGLISPIEWYYSYVTLTPLWDEETLAYRVAVPLVDKTPYIGYEVETFPIPVENSSTTIRLLASGAIAVDSHTGGVFAIKDCLGTNPRVCNPSPLRQNANNVDCLHALALGGDVISACPAEVETRPTELLFPGLPNHVILVTWKDHIVQRCPNVADSGQTIARGTYQIEWPGQCVLSTDDWTIPGLLIKETKKIIAADQWQVIDLEDFDLHEIATSKLDNQNINIEMPGQLPPPHTITLTEELPVMPSPINWVNFSQTNYAWALVIILIIGYIIAGIVIITYYRHKRQLERMPRTTITRSLKETNETLPPPPPFLFEPIYIKDVKLVTTQVDMNNSASGNSQVNTI
jgi:hypothetical protein